MKTCHNINIVVQNTGRYASPLNGKSEIPNNTFSNITRAVLLNLIHKKELVPSPISMSSGFFFGIRIGCVVMLLTSSGMEQDLHTNTSKNEMLQSTFQMGMLQEIILMIDHSAVISWDIQILKDLFSTGSQTRIVLSTEPIISGLMNIIIFYIQKTITFQVVYSFSNILKSLFIIKTSSTYSM